MATAPNAAIPPAWRAKAKRALTGDMRPEDWRHLISGLLEFFGEESEEPEHAEDAAKPKTLYVRRPLKNAADVVAWARKAGFSKTLTPADMHVTLAHSKTPVDWSKITPDATMTAADDGSARSIEKLGDKGAVVLRFTADNLSKRWKDLKDAGAVWDFPSYKPHVTLTYEGADIDLSKIKPFSEPLEFGPEIFEEVDEGWADKIKHAGDAALVLAQDRSIKEPDVDGRLHVTGCNICRESVDGYKGSEIPGFASLGLEADIIYQVYRPAEELEKAVETANGIPVLREHKPTSATDHKFWDTIGATGTTARWEPPFIVNDLAIWPAPDIKGIETKEKFNLSPGYRYVPTLQNGEFEGKKFQVRMTKIAFNHIAVVSVGRQGPEVAIDSALELQWALVENAILGLHETDLATRGPSGRV